MYFVLFYNKGSANCGRIFSDTLVFTGEILLTKLIGNSLERSFDIITDLFSLEIIRMKCYFYRSIKLFRRTYMLGD